MWRGNARATGTWSSVSDVRYKKNITPLANSLEKVTQLKGVSYEWKTDEYPNKGFTQGAQLGLIAQEVEAVIPELVSTDHKGYNTNSLSKLYINRI
jgi:hypothetical protein